MEFTEKKRSLPPQGTHTGILKEVIDLGTQENELYDKKQGQIVLVFALPDEINDFEEPFQIAKFYTQSLHEKSTLAKDLSSWLGEAPKKGVSPSELFGGLLGKAANITITHYTNNVGVEKARLGSIAPLKKGEKPTAYNGELIYFDLADYREAIFLKLPDFFKGIIVKSPEYQNLGKEPAPAGYVKPKQSMEVVEKLNDEIPF